MLKVIEKGQFLPDDDQDKDLVWASKTNEEGVSMNVNETRLRRGNPREYRRGQIRDIELNEVLHLLAHGDDQNFGGLTPDQLCGYLLAQGLSDPDVAFKIKAIQLHGCQSHAVATQLDQLLKSEYASRALSNPSYSLIDFPVQGTPGYHFVAPGGHDYSVEDDATWDIIKYEVNKAMSDQAIADFVDLHPTLQQVITATSDFPPDPASPSSSSPQQETTGLITGTQRNSRSNKPRWCCFL